MLKTNYVRNGYKHSLVWRDEKFAIVEMRDKISNNFICYEAFQIRIKKNGFGSPDDYPQECWPDDERWGSRGFSVYTLEQAHKKIELMKNRNNER